MLKPIAEWLVVMMAAWLVWALLAPITFEARKVIQPISYNCPSLGITHGVGSDLRTFERRTDKCSMYR